MVSITAGTPLAKNAPLEIHQGAETARGRKFRANRNKSVFVRFG